MYSLPGVNIDKFLNNYQSFFPSATLLPKMHMLEGYHGLKQWKVGFGCMGEQGGESLHANFNSAERAYTNMKHRVDRFNFSATEPSPTNSTY